MALYISVYYNYCYFPPVSSISVALFINVLFGLGGQFSEPYGSLAAFQVSAILYYYYVLSFLDKYIDDLVPALVSLVNALGYWPLSATLWQLSVIRR